MKKNNPKARKNQKVKRVSSGTNKGCRYSLTNIGFVPRQIAELWG